jgi:hypothetical protein
MDSIFDETGAVSTVTTPATATETEVSEGLRIARYCTLEELPGLVFGVMTVAYIIFSLASLTL